MAEKLIRVLITVTPEMADRLGAYVSSEEARREGIADRTQVVRNAINQYLNQKGV